MMGAGQLPPGSIQCPRCGFIGSPVAHGRETGTAVAAGLLINPIIGLATLALKRGELACPQCGLKLGDAKVFAVYDHARPGTAAPQSVHAVYPAAPGAPQFVPVPQPPPAAPPKTKSALGTTLLVLTLLVVGACVVAIALRGSERPTLARGPMRAQELPAATPRSDAGVLLESVGASADTDAGAPRSPRRRHRRHRHD